jgi:hypothetical protein
VKNLQRLVYSLPEMKFWVRIVEEHESEFLHLLCTKCDNRGWSQLRKGIENSKQLSDKFFSIAKELMTKQKKLQAKGYYTSTSLSLSLSLSLKTVDELWCLFFRSKWDKMTHNHFLCRIYIVLKMDNYRVDMANWD